MRGSRGWRLTWCGLALLLAGCTTAAPADRAPSPTASREGARPPVPAAGPSGTVTLAFAGDIHFQLHLAALLETPKAGLGAIDRVLSDADVAMVNLESAVTEDGSLDPKELEIPAERYWYRASPAAFDLLAAAGVDVVTMANNHGGDYGSSGLADTLRAARTAPVAVVGVGRGRRAAFGPYRVTVRGTRLAFLAADASPREGSSSVWEAGPATPGIAAARVGRPRHLLDAVRAANRTDDVVVVYLHWGREEQACPTPMQQTAARALSRAGADVIVGSHAHVQLGSGRLDGTYVNYGLGNFVWYHNGHSDTGVLRLRLEDGRVVSDQWVPARIGTWGRPWPIGGAARDRAIADWERLRGCADLAPIPDGAPTSRNRFESSVHRIDGALRSRMGSSHGTACPVAWRDLRLLRLSHVGFDGRTHRGELVVAAAYARDVVGVFEKLYDARWPIRRMRPVSAYGGHDNRSMTANNTSGYNCRRVADSDSWSAHAYGAAIDLNPVQNPYLRGASVAPPAGRRFAGIDRSPDARVPRGVIHADDIVVRAFADIGWEWGGTWADPDYQHFTGR